MRRVCVKSTGQERRREGLRRQTWVDRSSPTDGSGLKMWKQHTGTKARLSSLVPALWAQLPGGSAMGTSRDAVFWRRGGEDYPGPLPYPPAHPWPSPVEVPQGREPCQQGCHIHKAFTMLSHYIAWARFAHSWSVLNYLLCPWMTYHFPSLD